MPAERYYCPQEFIEQTSVSLQNTEFHHLTHVMRNREGESIEIVNGLGQLAIATIARIEKKQAVLNIEEVAQAPTLEIPPLILAQAIPRLSNLEWILEKATELGATEFWLFPAARTEKKQFSQNQSERLHTILISAMKQCGRLFLPTLIMMPPLKQWQNFYLPAYFGDVDPQAPFLNCIWQQTPPAKGSIFCVGPESGFTNEEVTTLKTLGAAGVKLNNNILRTETAAIAAMSLLSHYQQNDKSPCRK